MALSTYRVRRLPGLFCSVLSLTGAGAACASGTIVDDPLQLGDAGASAEPATPGLGLGDGAVRAVTPDASLGDTRASTVARVDAGDAALGHAGAPDATAPHVSPPTQQPASTTTTPPVSTTPPATTSTGSGTTSPGKLDASTPSDASGTSVAPATPGATGGASSAGTQQCKSDDDCAEVFCFPLGVAGCCRLDGVCGCTWSDAYCL